jgi:NAD(P)-dependent dehydrogenase (short-subunit alcohol dehydrogenase family)
MDLGISGKHAVVTGSSLGIGKAIARELLQAGATVTLTGRSEDRLKAAAAELSQFGPVGTASGDLSTAAGADAIVKAVTQAKPVDILVNNVGFFNVIPFFDLTDDGWQQMFDINVMSGVRLSRSLMKPMLNKGWGRIVFIASEQSLKPNPDMLHYAVSKTAQVAVARGLAELTKGTGVTVNSVLVAPTWTEGVEEFLSDLGPRMGKTVEEMKTAYFTEGDGKSSLLQHFADPADIAAFVAFLCSTRAAAINGSAQRADGGIVRSLF